MNDSKYMERNSIISDSNNQSNINNNLNNKPNSKPDDEDYEEEFEEEFVEWCFILYIYIYYIKLS